MADAQKTVFISYRRSVGAFMARAVFQDLRDHGYDVFMDVETINAGQFESVILAEIAARTHFLPVITAGTLERCVAPDDWVRREIETAIHLRRNIVPLFINNFDINSAREFLVGDLALLPSYTGINVPHDYFDAAMDKLRNRFLAKPVAVNIIPTPHIEDVQRKIRETANLPMPTETDLNAEQYFNRAMEKQDSGNLSGAIVDYSQAIRLKFDYADAYNNRGNCYYDLGDYPSALANFEAAININASDPMPYYNRGLACLALGRYEDAITSFTRSIDLNNPDLYLPYDNRGIAHERMGNYDEAIADHTEAIRLNPSYEPAYNNRGTAYHNSGRYAQAVNDYDAAIRLNPNYDMAVKNRENSLRLLEESKP